MKWRLGLTLPLLLAVAACSPKKPKGIDPARISPGPEGRTYLDGKPWTGEHVEHFANSKIRCQGQFRDGREDGAWIWYFPSGNIESEIHFQNGAMDGNETHRYDNERNSRSWVRTWKEGEFIASYHWKSDGSRLRPLVETTPPSKRE